MLGASAAGASENKIALIPGGPHPYFAPWEQAAADAQKDFGIAAVDFKVPAEWKLNLQTELLEVDARWNAKAENVTTKSIPLEKSDVVVRDFRLVWVPVA